MKEYATLYPRFLHGAVIDHNGKASGRVFEAVKQVGISLEKLDEICGTKTDAKVAIIYDHKNCWALSNASGFINADKKYVKTYDLPEGVTISAREQYLFVQNFNDYEVSVELAGMFKNMETGERYNGTICLNPFDIAVVY